MAASSGPDRSIAGRSVEEAGGQKNDGTQWWVESIQQQVLGGWVQVVHSEIAGSPGVPCIRKVVPCDGLGNFESAEADANKELEEAASKERLAEEEHIGSGIGPGLIHIAASGNTQCSAAEPLADIRCWIDRAVPFLPCWDDEEVRTRRC